MVVGNSGHRSGLVGKWIPRIERVEGAGNPTGVRTRTRTAIASRTGDGTGAASGILEGECKARSGIQFGRETDRMAGVRNTPGARP
jgi:hypothetical protein